MLGERSEPGLWPEGSHGIGKNPDLQAEVTLDFLCVV